MEQPPAGTESGSAAAPSASAAAPRLIVGPQDGEPHDEEACHVCNSGFSYEDDQILFCDGCDVAVHQQCYGVTEVPDGGWLCFACAAEEKRADPQWQPRCILCPIEGGAFMRVFDSDGKPRGDGAEWAHAACAAFTEETAINYLPSEGPIGVFGVGAIPADRWHLACSICTGAETSMSSSSHEVVGTCIQCWDSNCDASFHVLCARTLSLPAHLHQAACSISHADGFVENVDRAIPASFCPKHRVRRFDLDEFVRMQRKKRRDEARANMESLVGSARSSSAAAKARAVLNSERKRKAASAADSDDDADSGARSPTSVIMIDCDSASSESDEPSSSEEEQEEAVHPSGPKRRKPSPPTTLKKNTQELQRKQLLPFMLPAAATAAATAAAAATSSKQATPSILQPAAFAFGSMALGMKVRKQIPKKAKAAMPRLKFPAPATAAPFSVPCAVSAAALADARAVSTYNPYSPQILQALADASSTADRRAWLREYVLSPIKGHKNFAIFGPKFLAEPTSAVPHGEAGASLAAAPQSGLVILARWAIDVYNDVADGDEEAQRVLLGDIIHSAMRLHTELPSHAAWRAHGDALLGWLTMSLVNAPSLRVELEQLKSAIKKPTPLSPPISGAPKPVGPPQPIHLAHAHPASGPNTAASTPTSTPRSREPLRKDDSNVWQPPRSECKVGEFPREPVPQRLKVSQSIDVATLAREQIVLVHSNPHAPIPKRGQLKRTSELIRIIESHGAEKAIKKVEYAPGTIPWLLYEPRTQVPATASAHAAIVRPRLRAQFKSDAQLCTWQAAPDESYYPDSDDDDDDCDMAPDVKRLSREERHALKSRMRQQAHLAGTSSSAVAAPSVNAAGLADSASVVASQASGSTSASAVPSASFPDVHDIESIGSATDSVKLVEPSVAEQADSAQPTPPAAAHSPTASAPPVSATDAPRTSRPSHAGSISSHFPSQKRIAEREPERREREQRESRDRQRYEDLGRNSHHERDRVAGQDRHTRREQDRDRHSSRDQQWNKNQVRDRQRDHGDRHREADRRDDRSHQERRLREHEEEERDRDRRRPSGSDSHCHRRSRSRSRSRSRDRQRDRGYDRDRDRGDFAHREYGTSSRDRSHTYQRSASPSPSHAARTVVLARADKSSFTIGSGQAHGGPVRHCPRGEVHAADR